MGVEDTARRRIGPATRALAAPAPPPRRRLPTLQEAFDDEERSTDSEIENVLGGIESVPPMASAPEPPAPPREREESGIKPRSEVPPSPEDVAIFDDDRAVALRKRQLIVITAVCAFGALVLALAAVLHVVRGLTASERPSATQAAAQLAPAAPDAPAPAAPSGVTLQPAPAAPQPQTASHPPPSKRTYRSNSN